MDTFCGSTFWDINLTWNTEDPDFTPCLMETVLVWAPFAFLLLFAPLDIYYAKTSKYGDIPWGFHNGCRMLLIVLLVAHSVADLAVGATWHGEESNVKEMFTVHWVTPVIRIVMFTFTGALTLLHRKKGIVSSGLMTMFWLVYTILAIPQFRHEIRGYQRRPTSTLGTHDLAFDDYQFVSFSVHFSLLVLLSIFHLFADQSPSTTRFAHVTNEKQCPELRAGFVRRICFFWFDSVMWSSYRKALTDKDMFDIRPEDLSANMNPRFEKYWKLEVEKKAMLAEKAKKKTSLKKGDVEQSELSDKCTNGSIIPVLFKTFGGPFYLAGLLKLANDLLSFASPQVLSLLITFTLVPSIPMWHGFVYTVTFLVIYLITAFLNNEHQYLSLQVGYRIRAALVNAIYRKSLILSSSARRGTTNGEIVNLMSVDAQRFYELMPFLHIIWSGPLVLVICMYFLYDLLGVSAFAGLGALFLLIPINGFIASKLKYFQVKQMKKKDERIRTMNEILGGMKVLKLYAWENSFQAGINTIREKELQIIMHAAITNAYVFLMWNMVPFLVTLITFVTFIYADDNNKMTPNTLFVALSLFNILRMPMTLFPMMVTQVMQVWVGINRINKFLNNEDLDPNSVSRSKNANALEIKNGNFTWGGENDKALVLKNINLTVGKGQLAAIVGPVGCGKSSLVFSLLGDTIKVNECTANIDGSVAYVAQQAWIQNASLQDNILFGLPMEPAFYQKVLESCALLPDLKILPGGDQTEIGEKGINLSGGQKQRVALARAVYSRAEIYLLDDPLSAVDAHVGKHIFDKVIGPAGLLAGKTRLLVTHSISFLPQTNHIFVMVNGEISETGHYAQLLKEKGAFAEFLVEHMQNVSEEDEEEIIAIKEALTDTSIGHDLFQRAISVRTSITKKKISVTSMASTSSQPTPDVTPEPENASGSKLIQTEESSIGGVGLAVYFRYFQSIGAFFVVLIVIGTVMTQSLSIFGNTWLSEWSAHPTANDPETRAMYLGVYAAIGVSQGITLFVVSIFSAYGAIKAARVLHNKMLHTSMRLPMSFFDTTPLGRIANRFTKDVDVIDNVLPQMIRAWLVMAFATLGTLAVISISTPIFMAVIVPLAIVYYFIQRFYVVTSRQLKRIESVTRSPIYSHFGETINGQTTIRAFGVEERFRMISEMHVDENQKSVFESTVAGRWLAIRLEIIGALVLFFASLFAVLAKGSISGEMVGLSISYAMQITWTMSLLVRFTAEMETHIVAIERVEEYAEVSTEPAWETDKQVEPDWPSSGAVKFENVDLRYREGLDLVLRDVSFEIKGGEKIGIVGRTGAGKSSLTLALFRIVEAAGGQILIDGVPIDKLGLQLLRSRLTIIPQDPVLFGGTLRKNVDPFAKYSDDEVWTSLERAHLKSFVNETSSGLLHEVAEGGENLSIGQRQLVCLARALLRKTKLLILDEATAAIDLETDNLIQTTIREEFKDCTVLTIAHRLNTILDSDRVMVLENGKIKELDHPQVLLSNRKSLFYSMAQDSGITGASANNDEGLTGVEQNTQNL